MNADTSLPIITLVLGWAGAQVTEVFRDRRASNRDRLARQGELQGTTLLELQDALLEVSKLHNNAQFAARTTGSVNQRFEHFKEATNRLSEARDKARLLASRVLDDKARTEIAPF